jgi:hypothetical protein
MEYDQARFDGYFHGNPRTVSMALRAYCLILGSVLMRSMSSKAVIMISASSAILKQRLRKLLDSIHDPMALTNLATM